MKDQLGPRVVVPVMATSPPRGRVPSLVELLGIGAATLGAAGLACSLPSANIEPSQSPSDAPQTNTKQARTQAKAQRKAAAPRQGPTVIEAELIGEGEHLRLYFSEPLAPTDHVDPNDFRLSVAMAYAYKMYAYAYYYDAGLANGEALMEVTSMRGQENTLDLYLNPPFDLAYCEELRLEVKDMQSEPGVRADGGVFLHYAAGDVPITDPQGNRMAAIAAEWVLHRRRGAEDPEEMYLEGPPARRALREPIRVRCGPRLPPGPR